MIRPMDLWQRSMIALARSERLKSTAQGSARLSRVARRFVGGSSADAAVSTARRLWDDHGISSSLFYLGEYVDDPQLVDQNVAMAVSVVERLGKEGIDVNVSADPTALGHMADEGLFRRNGEQIAVAVKACPPRRGNRLVLDMEDLSLVGPTLSAHQYLVSKGLPVAVTLQARLRRSEQDLSELFGLPTAVRLVKGAFPLGPEHDYQGRAAITARFLVLAEAMLSARARQAGLYPVFATHDDVIARRVVEIAKANGRSPDEYEFELLYGVRSDWQLWLRARGFSVRVYLPFGTDWWPYTMRRVGENPRNMVLVGRALIGATYDQGGVAASRGPRAR
jgi:proline dehydrogenase